MALPGLFSYLFFVTVALPGLFSYLFSGSELNFTSKMLVYLMSKKCALLYFRSVSVLLQITSYDVRSHNIYANITDAFNST